MKGMETLLIDFEHRLSLKDFQKLMSVLMLNQDWAVKGMETPFIDSEQWQSIDDFQKFFLEYRISNKDSRWGFLNLFSLLALKTSWLPWCQVTTEQWKEWNFNL